VPNENPNPANTVLNAWFLPCPIDITTNVVLFYDDAAEVDAWRIVQLCIPQQTHLLVAFVVREVMIRFETMLLVGIP